MNQPLLSISILVSNNIDTVGKTLESIKPILNSVPSELIVIDTIGEEKSDGSLALASKYATKVIHFDWINDFSAARNAGLKECSGKWFMFIDDDEWFDDPSEIIQFFNSGEYQNYKSGQFYFRNFKADNSYVMCIMGRLAELCEGQCFVSPIHERFKYWNTPRKQFQRCINHTGYLFQTDEDIKQKSERNLSLLLPIFEADPWDIITRTQIVQEYLLVDKEKALALCEESLTASSELYPKMGYQWILATYVSLYYGEKKWADVERIGKLLRDQYPLSWITQIAIGGMEAQASISRKHYDNALNVSIMAMNAAMDLSSTSEALPIQLVMDFCRYLEPQWLSGIIKAGKLSAQILGRKKELSWFNGIKLG